MIELFSGAREIEQRPDGILPVRFGAERREEYQHSATAIYGRCTAGVRLDFVTSAPEISFDYRFHTLFYPPVVFDVLEDGEWRASIREPDRSSSGTIRYVRKKQSSSRITIYLPVHGETVLSHLKLGDPQPAPKGDKRLLVVSDSIGQGLFGEYPAGGYAAQLARTLKTDFYNLSVGGEIYRPELIERDLPYSPTQILIALGTNDLVLVKEYKQIKENIQGFYQNLMSRFHGIPTTVLTPIWQTDLDGSPLEPLFMQVTEWIRQEAEKAECKVVQGLSALSHQPRFFSDHAHPNDLGHAQLALGLLEAMK